MFSLKTLCLRPRRFLPAAICVIVMLLALEAAFRAGNWFYDYDGWESPGLQKKIERADDLMAEKGRIDLITMSTSIGRPIDVTQWEDATGGAMVAYNFGFPDQRPEKQYFLFKNYYLPRYHPKYVIYALSVIDCNGNVRGMNPQKPRDGPFWTYRNIRSMAADTIGEKVVSWLEDVSRIFRSRQRARFTLQFGSILMLQEEPTIGDGVIVPTVRHLEYGPQKKSWALHPLGLPYNCYHNYWIPDDGEIGQVLKIAKLCKENGIKFAVVDTPTSPYGHTNFDNEAQDYWKFQNALNYLRSKGVWVLPMAAALNLDNTFFEDQDHMNRWGGQLATNYIYKNVIRKWFPDTALAPSLPAPTETPFSDLVTSATPRVRIERRQTVTSDAQYASARQAVVTSPVDIPLSATLAAGAYAVELYAGDGTTTSPELVGEAKMELALQGVKGDIIERLPVDQWINSRVGISYTQAYFNAPSSGTLLLKVTDIGTRPLILDSVFIRPMLSHHESGIIID